MSGPLKTHDALIAPEFKHWFGDSKVVGQNGEPLVLYHSTRGNFDRFEKTADIGFHFGTEAQAKSRAEKKGNDALMMVCLAIKNPIELPDLGDWDFWRFTEDGMNDAYYEKGDGTLGVAFTKAEILHVAEVLNELEGDEQGWEWMRQFFESKGYDGIKYLNVGETKDEEAGDFSYIAFRHEQIKIIQSTPIKVVENKTTEPVFSP